MIIHSIDQAQAPLFYVFVGQKRDRRDTRCFAHVYHPSGAITTEFYPEAGQAQNDIVALKTAGYFDMRHAFLIDRFYMLAHPQVLIPFPSTYISMLHPGKFVPHPPLWERKR